MAEPACDVARPDGAEGPPIDSIGASTVRAFAPRSHILSLEFIGSIGLRSGLYGGR